MIEQRQYERVQFIRDVEISKLPGGGAICRGMSMDLSLGGLGLATTGHFETGEMIQITFQMDDKGRQASESVIGHVARFVADSEGNILGVKFLSPLDKSKCPLLVRRLMSVEGRPVMAFEDWCVAHARVSSKPHKAIKMEDKMTFFQQLSTLISSGTPLLQAIKITANQSQSIKMRRVLEEIAGRVAAGSSLNAAAAHFPNVFEHHWIEVIRTGEVTGKMNSVLLDLNRQIRESRETRRKVSGALMYPIILILFAIVAVTVMLWLVVPTFAAMFKDMGAELPGITQFVVDASGFIVKYGIYVFLAVGAVVFAFRKYYRTEGGKRRIGGIGLAVPLVGQLIIESAMYRFASNLALLLKSGIPMIETLQVLEGVFHGNPIYRDALARVQARVSAGRPLANSLEETNLFTTMMTNMVRIGEGSGQLSNVMDQIAPYYKEKMESLIAKLTKLMEPIIIVGMGVTIAGLMMSIYLPMFEMAGKVH